MIDDSQQQPDKLAKSLGDQATGADVSRAEQELSLGDQATSGDALSSLSDLSDLTDDLGDEMPIVDLTERYEIQESIGKGGMGEVLRALDRRLKRPVAIKRVLGKMTRSKKALSRFLTEAQSIAALNHFNIVQIHDYGRDAEGPFIIMELVEGESLQEKLKTGKLEIEEAVGITCQVCDALGKAHGAGIIHRDIKPANILLTEDGTPKLTDFGLARQQTADHGQTQAGAVLGTIDFMPPEQRLDATATDARSDLWSLAATLYQMITGEVPRVIDLDDVPRQLRLALSRALKSKQADRYQTAQEFRDALKGSLTTTSGPASAVAVDLGAGECVGCHTRNEATRRFCRECAAPLRVACLACEEEIPVWDKVCPECGGKQPELATGRREEIDAQRVQAESLLKELAFEESTRIAGEIAAIEDIRLQHLKEWSGKFIESIEVEKKRQQEKAAKQHLEAQEHHKAFDYKSAIQAMEAIPEIMRTTDLSGYLKQLQADQQESQQLLQTIEERIKRRDMNASQIEALDELLNRAIELRGDRTDLHELKSGLVARKEKLIRQREKLIRQRDEAYAEAEKLLEQGEAEAALKKVRAVKTKNLGHEDVYFKDQLEKIAQKRQELSTLVAQYKDPSNRDRDVVTQILVKTCEYLDLNPKHEHIIALRDRISDQINENPDKYTFGWDQAAQGEAVLWAREEKLIRQRDEAYAEAEKLLEQGEAEVALEKIQVVISKKLRSTDVELKDQLEQIAQKRKELSAWEEKYDEANGLDQGVGVELMVATCEYLDLNPNHQEIISLRARTLEKIIAQEEKGLAALETKCSYFSETGDAVIVQILVAICEYLEVNPKQRLTVPQGVHYCRWAEQVIALRDKISNQIVCLRMEDDPIPGRLTPSVLAKLPPLVRCPRQILLGKVLTKQVATEALAKNYIGPPLRDYEMITVAAAEVLGTCTSSLILDGLTSLSVEAAQALEIQRLPAAITQRPQGRTLSLNGLTSLSVEVAQALAKCEGELRLGGLTSLSDEAAEVLGKYGGGHLTVDFDKLPESAARILRAATITLTEEVAERFLVDEESVDLYQYEVITVEAAEVLAKCEGSFTLDGLTSLSVEAAEALAKCCGEINLNGLKSLSVELAKTLAKYEGYLHLNGLTSLSVDVAQALATCKGCLRLLGLTNLSDAALKALANFAGRSLQIAADPPVGIKTDRIQYVLTKQTVEEAAAGGDYGLDFSGYAMITVEAAQALAKCCGEMAHVFDLSLGGLTSLSDEAAQALAECQGSLHLDGLTTLSVEVAQALAKCKGMLSLGGLRTLSVEAAEAIAKIYQVYAGFLCLDGLTILSVEAAQALAKCKGDLHLDGLTTLSVEVGQALAKCEGQLRLGGLTTLSVELAKTLAKCKGTLHFDGLTTLSVEVAQALAKCKGDLHLDGLTTLSVEVAQALAKCKGRLYLDGLTKPVFPSWIRSTLSLEVAQALAKCKGTLHLNGLTSLSVEVAQALAKCEGWLRLGDLTSLSDEAAEVLGKYGHGNLAVDFNKLPESAARILREAGWQVFSS